MSGPWDDFQAGGTATAEPEPTPAKAAPAAGPWTDFQPAATEAASSPPDGGKPWADFQAPKPTSALKQLFPSLMDLSPEQQQQVDTVKGAWNQAQAAGVSVQDMAKHAQAVSDQWDDVLDEVRQNRPDQLANFQAQRDEAMRQAGVEPFHLEAPVQLPKLSEGDVHTLFPGAGPRAVNAIQSGQNMVAGTAEGFTSVEGQAMFLPGIGPAIGKAFMGQMALSVPEQLGQAAGHYAAGDTQSGDSALIQAGSTAAMLGMPLLAEKVAEKLARKPETVQTPGRPQEDWLPKPEASPEIKPWEDAAAAATGQTAEGGGAKMEGGNGPAAAVPPPAPGVEAAAKPPEPAEPAALPSRLVTQALMDMTGKREPVPVSVLTAAGVAPEALAEGYTLNADGTAYEFTPPAVKLTPEQEMARANVQAMAELRAAKAAAGGEAAEDGGSKIEEETKTEPAAAGAAEPMPVDVTPAEVKAAGAGARTEAAPDLLDVVGDHYPNGVKFDADDHGEIVRSSRGAAADQMFLTKGEPADQVLKGLHEAGLYPRLESADDLALAMRAAGESRLAQRAPDTAAAVELAQQQKRTQMFQESALKARAEAEALPAQQLFNGDTFKVNGKPVRVTDLVTDAETGRPAHVEVDGAFGRQTIPAEAIVHLDKDSLKSPILDQNPVSGGKGPGRSQGNPRPTPTDSTRPDTRPPAFQGEATTAADSVKGGRSYALDKAGQPSEGKGDESAPHQAPIHERIFQELADQFGAAAMRGLRLVAPDLRDDVTARTLGLSAAAREGLEKTFGVKIQFLLGDRKLPFSGFRDPLAPGVLWIDARNPRKALTVASHELLHDLRSRNPDVYRQLDDALAGQMQNFPLWQARQHARYDAASQPRLAEPQLREELYADFLAEQANRPAFWNELAAKEPGLFQSLAKTMLDWLTQIHEKLHQFAGGAYFKDVRQARSALVNAMAQFARRQAESGDGGRQFSLGERQFNEQLQDATDISEALKGKVTNTQYERRPQEDDQTYAQRIVQDVGGPDRAIQVFRHEDRLPEPVKMAMGMQILKSLDAAGRHADAANFFDNDLAPHTTDVAQGLAMLNAWHAMSKDGKLNWAQLKILRAAKDATDPVRPDIEAAKAELQRQNAAGIEGTTADPAVQASAKEAITDAVTNSPETHKGIIMELTQPWASSQFILDTARQHVNAKANELLNKAPMPIGFTPSQYLRSIMDDLAKRAAGIAAGHYQGAEPGVILRDKLQQRLGLSPDAASRLANALDKEFARQVKAAQDALPKRLARKVAQPERQKNTAAASRAEREGRARQARSIPDHEAEAAAQRLMETATSAGKDKPALQEFYQRLTTSLRRLLPEGTPGNGAKLTDIQRIAEAFANPEHFEEVWQRLGTELRAKYGIEGMADVQTTLGKLTPEALVETQLDRSMRAQMATMKVNLGQLVREHWTKVDATGAELADKLVQQAGLGREASAKLAEVIQRRFEALTARAKTAALDKLLQPVKKLGLAKPQMVEKLVKLSYLGAFDDGKFWNAIKERMNLPEWTNKLRDQLNALADKIGRIPADRIEDLQRAQTEFLNTIERAKGVSNLELGLAFYMQNILSGLTTHVRVAIHTSAQMMAATTAETGRALVEGRVSDIPLIYEALARGAGRALTQQKDIFRSGLVVGSKLQKVVPLSVLEQIHFGREGGTTVKQGPIARALLENRAASLLNLWKYNSRLITAQHMLYFAPAEEMKVALLAARQARTEGLTGRAAVDRARQMLGYGAAQVRAAEAQAIREGLEGTRAKMRVAEILKSSLPTAMKETARDYALRQTFLNEPYGFAGAIANLVNTAKQSQHPVLSTAARVIVPFTRIAANLFNEGLNYTPIGAARARLAKTELMGEKFADITPEVRTDLQRELYAKSALGTMLLTGIALKAAQGLSQPNPGFTVYGAGPSNPQDKSAWRAAGGIPYSAKVGGRYVSYANTPGNVMLAALGNYLDGARDAALYQRPGAKRLAEDLPMRAVAATMGAGKVILEQPFLQSLVELANMAGENNPEISARGAVKTAARTGSSFVVPNLLRQVDRFYDPTAYDQKTLSGILTSQVPFVRQSGRPMLNALGQPIQSPVFGMFTGPATADPLVQTLTQHNAWPALPNRNQVTVNGVPLSDDEFYLYAKTRGQALADLLSRPSVKTMLDTLATQSDRLNAQAAAAANPVAKARLQAAASSLQSKVMGKYTAVADKLADAAVIRTRGY